MYEKQCKVCKKVKICSDFYLEGRGRGDGYRARCKECSHTDVERARGKRWRAKNPTTIKRHKRERRDKLAELGDTYIKRSIRGAIKRAKAKGYSNYDSHADLFKYLKSIGGVPEKCPILGLTLEYGGGSSSNSPSLDRIDVRKGYQVGNVWFISARANMMKNDATFPELLRFCRYFISNFTSWGRKRK